MRSHSLGYASRPRGRSGARSRRLLSVATLAVAAGLAALPVQGHDFWIEPDSLATPAGAQIAVSLRVGDAFAGEPVARNPRWIERFVAVGPGGESPVPGADGRHPAGQLRPTQSGAYWLLYRSRPTRVTLDAERFESYLAEEGLDHIRAARQARGEIGDAGRERFSRCAKALIRVQANGDELTLGGGYDPAFATQPTGLDLDLVPQTDPQALGGGGELPIRLLYLGEPLAGTLLEAYGPNGRRLAARTDEDGGATFDLTMSGDWLITAVHMVPAVGASDVDWESLWASLRFTRPAG